MTITANPDILTWLHLEYLQFLALPILVYLFNIMTIKGVILPTLISTGLLLKYWRQVKDQQIVLGFLLFAVTAGMFTQYWGITGLHLFTGGFVIWPVLVLLLGDRFPWPLAYPLTFIGTLIPDLYDAGTAADWQNGWFFDVGGAGFRDGLFLVPLETLMAAAMLNKFGIFMRKRGYFSRRMNLEKDAYPKDRDRRAR
ncbi:DUF1614 domain-containing protein [Acidithiobacillus ferriphilus]|uniref:DUF1614 domain-containing protein n=1 Tax=Acidithiobacillus ferriphilus TaxID=1689834 RepID=UPI001C07503C|nr:DUF1614 domain-containing protein [Acidithiobacillus ferriphilus]MBU2846163.1 DUF1614 domain-containing protein [Acidithiobacillus ferriphilus]